MQDEPLPGQNLKFGHTVNLALAQQVCKKCEDEESVNETCSLCGKREHLFLGTDSLTQFMQYLVEKIDEKFRNVICLAHYMKGFDGQFILKYMYENNSKWSLDSDSLIINGTKIMRIKVGRYMFLDSINYLCFPLSKLPKMFNIPETKGWFPHLFHSIKNMGYD